MLKQDWTEEHYGFSQRKVGNNLLFTLHIHQDHTMLTAHDLRHGTPFKPLLEKGFHTPALARQWVKDMLDNAIVKALMEEQ